ncbi:MAG: methyltransferase [Porphyromonas sp.]|nr:methyltransferase [Porphyromonas sp.]
MDKKFYLKQFSITHHRSAMKVGTDALILGALAGSSLSIEPNTVLDIGTGCGIVALMLSQRFKDAAVTGVDIHDGSVMDAEENRKAFFAPSKLKFIHADIEQFAPRSAVLYDLIVSNPPYFTPTHSSPSELKTLAKHALSLPADKLFVKAKQLLSPEGELVIIYPFSMADYYEEAARKIGLVHSQKISIRGRKDLPVKRFLSTWQMEEREGLPVESELIIEVERHRYTPEYKAIMMPFMLDSALSK